MKNEQLLEAIGYADEQLLMETEHTPRQNSFRIGRMVLVAAIVSIFTAVTVMASTGFFSGLLKAEENGSSISNLSTSLGNFVYAEDGIYYGATGFIYKCDFNGNTLMVYPLSNALDTPHYMFVTEDAIIYAGINGLCMQPKDGSEPVSICPDLGVTVAYADGNQLYVTNGATMLSRINLVTLEQVDLLENVSEYFVDENYIYAVQSGVEHCYYRSSKDVINFEKIEIDFDPNKIIADGDDLYICQWLGNEGRRYQVNLVHDGEASALPVHSWLYQVLDGFVIYLEDQTYTLKCYDVSTGKTTKLAENVFEFSVLDDRYVCIEHFNQSSVIYDWETRTYSQIKTNH